MKFIIYFLIFNEIPILLFIYNFLLCRRMRGCPTETASPVAKESEGKWVVSFFLPPSKKFRMDKSRKRTRIESAEMLVCISDDTWTFYLFYPLFFKPPYFFWAVCRGVFTQYIWMDGYAASIDGNENSARLFMLPSPASKRIICIKKNFYLQPNLILWMSIDRPAYISPCPFPFSL